VLDLKSTETKLPEEGSFLYRDVSVTGFVLDLSCGICSESFDVSINKGRSSTPEIKLWRFEQDATQRYRHGSESSDKYRPRSAADGLAECNIV
jgi:hypothetical protein